MSDGLRRLKQTLSHKSHEEIVVKGADSAENVNKGGEESSRAKKEPEITITAPSLPTSRKKSDKHSSVLLEESKTPDQTKTKTPDQAKTEALPAAAINSQGGHAQQPKAPPTDDAASSGDFHSLIENITFDL